MITRMIHNLWNVGGKHVDPLLSNPTNECICFIVRTFSISIRLNYQAKPNITYLFDTSERQLLIFESRRIGIRLLDILHHLIPKFFQFRLQCMVLCVMGLRITRHRGMQMEFMSLQSIQTQNQTIPLECTMNRIPFTTNDYPNISMNSYVALFSKFRSIQFLHPNTEYKVSTSRNSIKTYTNILCILFSNNE